MYKLIALDLDGTLLKEDKTISKKTRTAIEQAKAKGIKIVLATGRPTRGIEKYLKQLDLISDDEYAVSYNGAIVQNTKSGKVIVKDTMTFSDLMSLNALSEKLNVNIHFLTLDSCYTPKWNKYSQLEADMNDVTLRIQNFETLDSDITIIKIMFIDDAAIIEEAINHLPEGLSDKFSIMRSEPYFLEFLNKGVNKSTGVSLLADILKIRPEEIICVGDAGNDIHMIKYAGLGVAMGNAFAEVKKSADFITHTNEEDGVAHVINKYILAS